MIVRDVSCQRREAKVGVEGKSNVVEFKTCFPMIPFFMMNLKLSVDVLNVDKLALCSDFGVAEIDGATSNFLSCAIFVVFVRLYAVAIHNADSGEGVRMPGVGVGVKEDA